MSQSLQKVYFEQGGPHFTYYYKTATKVIKQQLVGVEDKQDEILNLNWYKEEEPTVVRAGLGKVEIQIKREETHNNPSSSVELRDNRTEQGQSVTGFTGLYCDKKDNHEN